MKTYRWIGLILMVMLVMTLVITGCDSVVIDAGPTEEQDDTFTVDGPPILDITTENGKIDIDTGVDGEVHVHAKIRGVDVIDYEVSQEGNKIIVEADINRSGTFSNVGVDITITTPVVSDLDLNTSNGRIDVDRIEGTCLIRTSNGEISLEDIKGDVDAKTSNGRINIDQLEGTAKLRTSNGEIDLEDMVGEVDASTSNGAISFEGSLIAGSDNRLESSNGRIEVELWAPISINLDASTSNGDIDCEVPILATTTKDDHLVGTIGDGEADLYIDTSNSDVIIKEVEVVETPVVSPIPPECKGEGEGIPVVPEPPECCEGLDLIPPWSSDVVGITGICTANCGNGVCDSETETEYNCPEDCGNESEPITE